MRKRSNTPFRRITAVRASLARERVAQALARRLAAAASTRAPDARTDASRAPPLSGMDHLDLDQRVRLVGEW